MARKKPPLTEEANKQLDKYAGSTEQSIRIVAERFASDDGSEQVTAQFVHRAWNAVRQNGLQEKRFKLSQFLVSIGGIIIGFGPFAATLAFQYVTKDADGCVVFDKQFWGLCVGLPLSIMLTGTATLVYGWSKA